MGRKIKAMAKAIIISFFTITIVVTLFFRETFNTEEGLSLAFLVYLFAFLIISICIYGVIIEKDKRKQSDLDNKKKEKIYPIYQQNQIYPESQKHYKYCPNCGVSCEDMKFCHSCGNKLAVGVDYSINQHQLPIQAAIPAGVEQNENTARCPKCNSTSLTANKKGFGIGKAIIGATVIGPIGLMAGNIRAKKIRVTCLKCGNQFWAGKGY